MAAEPTAEQCAAMAAAVAERNAALNAMGDAIVRNSGLYRALGKRPPLLQNLLMALGPPGSPPVLEALAFMEERLLRDACKKGLLAAVAPLVRAYGTEPAPLATLMGVLDANRHAVLHAAACSHAGAVAALLKAYRAAGRSLEVLAIEEHAALRGAAAVGGPVVATILAEYGAAGGGKVLAALAAGGHDVLARVCRLLNIRDSGGTMAAVTAAYGRQACVALHAAIAHNGGAALSSLILNCFGVFAGRGPAAGAAGAAAGAAGAAVGAAAPPGAGAVAAGAQAGGGASAPARTIRLIPAPGPNAALAVLLRALGERDNATAVRALDAWLSEPADGQPRAMFSPASKLPLIPRGSPLAQLAVGSPRAWALLGPRTASILLPPSARRLVATPVLLAVKRLPSSIVEPVSAYLAAHPWQLYSGGCVLWLVEG